jgi:hypothetical protein
LTLPQGYKERIDATVVGVEDNLLDIGGPKPLC